MRRIVNLRPTLVELPACGGLPGVVLGPGGNNVPAALVAALQAAPADSMAGQTWARLLKGAESGPNRGPWVSVDEDPKAVAKPQGPEIPVSLEDAGYSVRASVKFVALESDPDVLGVWAEHDTRSEVKTSIATRLRSLGRKATEDAGPDA